VGSARCASVVDDSDLERIVGLSSTPEEGRAGTRQPRRRADRRGRPDDSTPIVALDVRPVLHPPPSRSPRNTNTDDIVRPLLESGKDGHQHDLLHPPSHLGAEVHERIEAAWKPPRRRFHAAGEAPLVMFEGWHRDHRAITARGQDHCAGARRPPRCFGQVDSRRPHGMAQQPGTSAREHRLAVFPAVSFQYEQALRRQPATCSAGARRDPPIDPGRATAPHDIELRWRHASRRQPSSDRSSPGRPSRTAGRAVAARSTGPSADIPDLGPFTHPRRCVRSSGPGRGLAPPLRLELRSATHLSRPPRCRRRPLAVAMTANPCSSPTSAGTTLCVVIPT